MSFTSFEDIEAWQGARVLTRMIGNICKRAPACRDFEWCNQIMSSALSITANIAEGNDSQSDHEFAKFLGYAKRSAAETRSHLYYGLDRSYMSLVEFNEILECAMKISGQLSCLIQYLRSEPRKLRSSFNVRNSNA